MVSVDEARLFLKMMEEVYPHLKSKAEELRQNLEGVIPSTFFFDIEEQIQNLQKMKELLGKQVEADDKRKAEEAKALKDDPTNIFREIGHLIKDADDI